ncbi:MAG TPA: AI-2E family transporter [Methyloceanibacter sp.]|nr:AI-2E family transporter [Methyloceanibacter sp.]
MADTRVLTVLVLSTIVVLAAALYLAASIFAPLTFGLFILALVWPMHKWLHDHLPRALALFVTLAVTITVFLVFASMIAWALSAIADWLVSNIQRFQTLYVQLTDWLESHGIFVAGTLADTFDVTWLIRMFQEAARRLNRLTGFGILVFVFLMLALLETEEFRRRLAALGKGAGDKLITAAGEIAAKFRKYMIVRTQLSVLTGLLVWGFAMLAGVEPAAAWGLLAFALNYIPFIGSFIATILPGLFAMVQLDTWQGIIIVFAGLGIIQFLIGNYLEPLVAGAALSISPFAVVFAVFFWGFLWGIPGAFIGVPILITVIVICAQYPSSRWIADLLSGNAPNATEKN